ncbi:flavin reductase family protein [Anditalea andensis]|uniref:Flavin reductase n=1 Tax=Anditalea andensis TaxID=1048983 RepID=A0A074LLG2_9BACT|nr:flavin reductase family protein [Anditalea andensis]KEO74677.1 flavin reductase [Anditalea andensis]
MSIIDPKKVSTGEFHGYMLGAIAPRPIAFASTVDKEGNVNLSPFSFFNVFGSNPPVIVFSPARRVRDNTTKHTLENVHEVPEVVINIVNFSIVEQMSLASTEYDKGVNEFIKSGLTPESSLLISPPRVKEAPVAFECKVLQIIPIGEEGGAANLVVCEILLAHIKDEILDNDGKIDPFKLDPVARMGGDWYCRATGDALFEIPKPLRNKGIGVDQIPESVLNSIVLTGNNLGRLGNVEKLPSQDELHEYMLQPQIQEMKIKYQNDPESFSFHLHKSAQQLIEDGKVHEAWLVLLQDGQ